MSGDRKLPIGPSDDEIAKAAVEEFKGGGGRKAFSAMEVAKRATALLMKLKQERAKGLLHYGEDGQLFDTVDAAMAYALAGRKLETKPAPKEEGQE